MRWCWTLFCFSLASSAHGQDSARAVIERAVKAHGGADEILKLRKAKVTYHLGGILPGWEHAGALNVEIEELYDLPRIKKTIEGLVGGQWGELFWGFSARNECWTQENRGPVHFQSLPAKPESTYRPFLIIERLVDCLRDDVEMKRLADVDAEIGAQKQVFLTGVSIVSVKHDIAGDLFFSKETGLLTSSIVPRADGQKQEAHFFDHKAFGDLTLFAHQTTLINGKSVVDLAIREVTLLKEVNDDKFEPPGSRTPVAAPRRDDSTDDLHSQDNWYLWLGVLALVAVVIVAFIAQRKR